MAHWKEFSAWLEGLIRGRARPGEGDKAPLPPDLDPDRLSLEALAYVGDAVYELFVRTQLIYDGFQQGRELHREAVRRVKAPAQARKLWSLEEKLTEQERALIRRARNAHIGRVPKGAQVMEYRYSTALEVLVGYLFLKSNVKRLEEILQFCQGEETEV